MANEIYIVRSSKLLTSSDYTGDVKIIIAQGGILQRVKDWIKEKWTGFKEFEIGNDSRTIDSIRYNKRKRLLEIRFHKRGIFQYANVPEEIVQKLLEAPSKGRYFNRYIRPKYRYKRVARILKIASLL